MRTQRPSSLNRENALAALLAAALLVAATLFRSIGTLAEPRWLDEGYSAYAAAKGWAFLWHVVPRYETHPPFYYSLLRLWTLGFGDSLLAMRALGILCAVASLAPISLCGREAARPLRLDGLRRTGLALALLALAALSPPLVEMAREIRPYPLLILAYAGALLAILRLGRRAALGAPLASRGFALYLVAQALILWLHNLGPLFAGALGLALLASVLRRSLTRRDWTWLVGGHLLVALVYLPALLILLDQAPTWVRSTWLHFSFHGLGERLAVLYALPGALPELAAALLCALGVAALVRSGEGRRTAAVLLIAALLPVIASISISALVAPVFILRTMTPVAVPTIVLMGIGAVATRGAWRWPAWGALAVLVIQFALVDYHARQRPPQQDWYGAVRWLAARHRPGDVILAYPNEGALPFDYAVRDLRLELPSRPIPTPVPSIGVGGWYPTGSRGVVSLPRDRLRAIAREPSVSNARTVWLLRLGPKAYDKGDMFLQELSVGRRRAGRFDKDPIDIIGLRRM